jgi:hypothetical protein
VKRRRSKDQVLQRVVKQERWNTNVCVNSLSETCGMVVGLRHEERKAVEVEDCCEAV